MGVIRSRLRANSTGDIGRAKPWTVLAGLTLIGLVVPALATGAAESARADTVTFRDTAGGPTGAHRIVRVRIDNTGPRVGVAVRHAGEAWIGRVTLSLDTTGDPSADHVAGISHAQRPRARAIDVDGTPWRCPGMTIASPPLERVTRLFFHRSCAELAPKLGVRVAVDPVRGRTHVQSTPLVENQSRPNILVLVTDDMRADDLTYMPRTRKWLGDRGTTWTNSLAPYPLCCPARASIFTGKYSHNHDVFSQKPPYGFSAFDDSSTIATWLQDAGYRTALLGKYLNGYGGQPRFGSDSGSSVRYTPPGWDDWQGAIDGGLAPDHPKNGGTYRYWDTTLSRNQGRGLRNLTAYQTYAYGDIENGVIRKAASSDRPFFSYVGFTAPHVGQPREPGDPVPVTRDDGNVTDMRTPAVPAPLRGSFDSLITEAPGAEWLDPDSTDKPEELLDGIQVPPNKREKAGMLEVTRQRAESLRAVDNTIARIMLTLANTGELADTYVVFTSDNGYFLGEQGVRLGKTLPYEPALRTPLLIRGPGIPAGQVRTDPFLSIDLAPTIMQMADGPIPASVDGEGLLDVAQLGDRGWDRTVLVNTGPRSTIRDTDESGVPVDPEDPGPNDQRYLLGVRTAHYLYTDRASGFEELYDLGSPEQYINLVDDPQYATVVEELRSQLHQIRACAGAGCQVLLPEGLRAPPGYSQIAAAPAEATTAAASAAALVRRWSIIGSG